MQYIIIYNKMELWKQIKTLVFNELKYGEKGLSSLDRFSLSLIGVGIGGVIIYLDLLYIGIAAISLSSFLAGYFTKALKDKK